MGAIRPVRIPTWVKEIGRFVRRLAATVAGAALLVFVAVEVSIPRGFEAVVLPSGVNESSPRDQAIVDIFHLDQNILVRYFYWIAGAVQGNFGLSTKRGAPVTELMIPRLPISIEFVLVGAVGALLLGVPLGLLSAAWTRRKGGTVLNAIFGLSQSIPVFITPIFLIWLFAVKLQWLPAAGWVRIGKSPVGNLRSVLLPAAALIFAEVGIVARIIRADALEVMSADYITAAMGKGLSSTYIVARHVLRPASLGLLNVVGLNIASVLSGSMIVELIFGIGGLGQLVLEATLDRDLYLLLALTTYVVTVYVTLNTIVDITMRALDPRITKVSQY